MVGFAALSLDFILRVSFSGSQNERVDVPWKPPRPTSHCGGSLGNTDGRIHERAARVLLIVSIYVVVLTACAGGRFFGEPNRIRRVTAKSEPMWSPKDVLVGDFGVDHNIEFSSPDPLRYGAAA